MLVIRLRRTGSKKRPYFRVVVANSAAPSIGSFVEILGYYNPRAKPAVVKVDRERIDHWVKQGARPSDSVRTLIARHLSAPAPATAAAPKSVSSASEVEGGL